MAEGPGSCAACGDLVEAGPRWVLVRGRRRAQHCSETCLHASVAAHQRARTAARRRWYARLLVLALLAAGGGAAWRRFHAPPPRSISYAWLEELPAPETPPPPVYYGPAWPPTDEDWAFAFERASWVYPLPGPLRRPAAAGGRIFAADPQAGHLSVCRQPGRCAVDLGGQLWGEHVYAAADGVVDRVQSAGDGGGDARGGGHHVRLAHFGGMAFTQYFHLAAVPRGLRRGGHVRAGDVIGLLGDTGLPAGAPRHLSFALSVRPASAFPEIYWDPAPLMATWPLRTPARGTVAGLTPPPSRSPPPGR